MKITMTRYALVFATLMLSACGARAAGTLSSPDGMTLYIFDKDKDGMSSCYGDCAVPFGDGSSPPSHLQKEHGYLLNRLVSHAFADGCDFVATFDMDSWPVLPRWDEHYVSRTRCH